MRVFDSYLLIKGLFVWNRYSTAESHRATTSTIHLSVSGFH